MLVIKKKSATEAQRVNTKTATCLPSSTHFNPILSPEETPQFAGCPSSPGQRGLPPSFKWLRNSSHVMRIVEVFHCYKAAAGPVWHISKLVSVCVCVFAHTYQYFLRSESYPGISRSKGMYIFKCHQIALAKAFAFLPNIFMLFFCR